MGKERDPKIERYSWRVFKYELPCMVAGVGAGLLAGNFFAGIIPELRVWNGILVAGTSLLGGGVGASLGMVYGVKRLKLPGS